MDRALRQVEEALDGVHAALHADDPDLVIERRWPASTGARHPHPNQHPATTRQRAELARLRASALHQEGLQVRAQAEQLHQATRALRAFLHRPHQDHGPDTFIWVSPAILLRSQRRRRW